MPSMSSSYLSRKGRGLPCRTSFRSRSSCQTSLARRRPSAWSRADGTREELAFVASVDRYSRLYVSLLCLPLVASACGLLRADCADCLVGQAWMFRKTKRMLPKKSSLPTMAMRGQLKSPTESSTTWPGAQRKRRSGERCQDRHSASTNPGRI